MKRTQIPFCIKKVGIDASICMALCVTGRRLFSPRKNKRRMTFGLLWLSSLFIVWPTLAGTADNMTVEPGIEARHREQLIPLSPIPPVTPEIHPVTPYPGSSSPVSVDNLNSATGFVRFEPYNLYPHELDLWNLEGQRFVRSLPVLAPDKSSFAYTEVLFMPSTRQTITRLYLVAVPPRQKREERLPSEEALHPQPEPDPTHDFDSFNPDKTLSIRQVLLSIGYDKVKPYDFRSLTIVDWSASGRRLLFKQWSGVLHVGLKTSDILVYDQAQGVVTIYPEIHRAVRHYWETQGNLPHVAQLSWDVQPLGWEAGSDNAVLLKGWAYDKSERKFLGLWRYDVDAARMELLSLEDAPPTTVATNGWLPCALPVPPPMESNRSGRVRRSKNTKTTKSTQ